MLKSWKRRLLALIQAAFSVAILLAGLAVFLVVYPDSPLPEEWNPNTSLVVTEPVTLLTRWKLVRALGDGEACVEALQTAGEFTAKPDFEHSAQCHIRDQVALRGLGGAAFREVETRCQVALRTAMWLEHGIKPAAQLHFGQGIARVAHQSSYSCRPIRNSTRISTHASADAIDIRGFELTDGRRITLLDGWNSADEATSAFLRETRDTACDWFRVVLGPDYNRLHADHFHLQHTGWGLCS